MTIAKDELLGRFDNDMDLIREVLNIFIDSSQNNIDAIEAAIAEHDIDKLTLNAHSLKGAASNFSSTIVTEPASELESMGKSKDISQATDVLERLKAENVTLISDLKKITAD